MPRLDASIVLAALLAMVVGCGGGTDSTPPIPTLNSESVLTINCVQYREPPQEEPALEVTGNVLDATQDTQALVTFWRNAEPDSAWHAAPGLLVLQDQAIDTSNLSPDELEELLGQSSWTTNLGTPEDTTGLIGGPRVLVATLYPLDTYERDRLAWEEESGGFDELPAGYTAISDEFTADLGDPQNPTPPCP